MFGGNIWIALGCCSALLLVAFAPERWAVVALNATETVLMTAWRAVTFLWLWVASLDHTCEEVFTRVSLTRITIVSTLIAAGIGMLAYFVNT